MGLGRLFKKYVLRKKKKKKNGPSSPKGVSKPQQATRSENSPTNPTAHRDTGSPRSPNQTSPIYAANRASASAPAALGSGAYEHIPPGGLSFGAGSTPSQPPAPINVAGVASAGTGAGHISKTQVINQEALAENKKNRELPEKYVRDLNKYGAINADWNAVPALDYDIEGRPEGLNMRQQVPNVKEPNDPIHPCFRRTMFYYISDADYELLKPSMRLASCYLDDPRIIPFFHGILHRPWQLHPLVGKLAKPDLGKKFYTFRERQPQNDAEWMATYKAIVETRKYIDFEFALAVKGAIAETSRHNAILPNGLIDANVPRRASINIHEHFLPILRGHLKPSSILLPDELGEPLDDASALLRVRFILGKVFIHEFAHAFSHIHFPLDPDVADNIAIDEPFYGDHRLAEIGFALEQFINGVAIQSVPGNKLSTVDCAYGLITTKFPGITRGHTVNAFELAPPIKYGVLTDTYFAVPMDSVAKVFTKRFWDDVQRYGGLEAFKPRKVRGLCYTVKDTSTWDNRDSPGVRRVADEPSDGGYDPADSQSSAWIW